VISDGQLSTSPGTITFTPQDWEAAQGVTVKAIDDRVTEGDHFGKLKLVFKSTDAMYNGINVADLTAKIIDNDSLVMLREPTGPTYVTRQGLADVYTVVLYKQPSKNVKIYVKAGKKVKTNRKVLTFTPKNYMIPQTVRVWASTKAKGNKRQYETIKHVIKSGDVAYKKTRVRNIRVVIDNKRRGGGSGVGVTTAPASSPAAKPAPAPAPPKTFSKFDTNKDGAIDVAANGTSLTDPALKACLSSWNSDAGAATFRTELARHLKAQLSVVKRTDGWCVISASEPVRVGTSLATQRMLWARQWALPPAPAADAPATIETWRQDTTVDQRSDLTTATRTWMQTGALKADSAGSLRF
jgi:hypothetical protein